MRIGTCRNEVNRKVIVGNDLRNEGWLGNSNAWIPLLNAVALFTVLWHDSSVGYAAFSPNSSWDGRKPTLCCMHK